MLVKSLEYIPGSHQSDWKWSVSCVATIQHLNYNGHFFLLAVCFWQTCNLETRSRSPKQNNDVEPEQAYYHAKFERDRYYGIREKANVKGISFLNEVLCKFSYLNM